ncbi:MAG: hypothetical protein NZ519_11210, partial [Bacteroidia bacterium]|nr:hypothetical protein [Bacteroidia bacterium]
MELPLPARYNCRCTVKKLSQLPEGYQDKPIDAQPENELFDNNPGITGVAFKNTHRYFREGIKNLNIYEKQILRQIREDVSSKLQPVSFYSDTLKKEVVISNKTIKEA